MKTIYYKVLAAAAIIFGSFGISANAQESDNAASNYYKPYFVNGDWQFNAPFTSNFTNRASGWGMNFEGGLFVTPNVGVGVFVAYHSNHKSVGEATIPIADNASLTTAQARSLYQVPFGFEARYRFVYDNLIDPYVQLRVGPEYARLSSYFSTFKLTDANWGFFISPEIGTNIWLNSNQNIGLHVALYYTFSTNSGKMLNGSIDNINNIGFRLGLAF